MSEWTGVRPLVRGLGWGSTAEYGGADAHGGGSFFDRNGKVIGHADGEFGESGMVELKLVAKGAKLAEVRASSLRVGRPGRNGHETGEMDGGEIGNLKEEVGEEVRSNAVLRVFVGEFDLDEDRKRFSQSDGGSGKPLRGLDGIDCVDGLEQFRGASSLVALKGTDEMDLRSCVGIRQEALEELRFGGELLHAILAEEALPGCVCFEEGFRGMHLGDGHEADVLEGAICTPAGDSHFFADAVQVFCDGHLV